MSAPLFARSLLITRSFPVLIAGALLAAPAMGQTTPAEPATGRAHVVVERRIADMRTKLKITPDETKAYDDFAQVMRDNAARMDGLMKDQAPKLASMSAVDQMKSYEAVTQAQADDMQRLVPAFSRLYDMLTPAQKKIADDASRDAMMGRRG